MSNTTHSDNDLNTSRAAIPQLKIEREKGGRGRDMVKNQTPGIVTHKWNGCHRQKVLPEKQGFQCCIRRPLPWGCALWRWATIMSGVENQWGLTLGEPEGYRKTGTLVWNTAYTVSPTVRPSTEAVAWKVPGLLDSHAGIWASPAQQCT